MIDKYNEAGISPIEEAGQGRAKPAEECMYPKCEDCDKYHGHWCTVPMVVSKQDWLSMHAWAQGIANRVCELETLVTDEILRSGESRAVKQTDPPNFTWDDYLKENE